MGQKQLNFLHWTTLTTKKLSIFLDVQKFGENAEQVLQVLLAKNFKNSGKQVQPFINERITYVV